MLTKIITAIRQLLRPSGALSIETPESTGSARRLASPVATFQRPAGTKSEAKNTDRSKQRSVARSNLTRCHLPPSKNVVAGVVLAGMMLLSLPAQAQVVVFTDNFDAAIPPAVVPGTALLTGVQGYAGLGHPGNQFGGRFLRSPTGNIVTLSLTGLPTHSAISIDFLFAAIDSLDGTGKFPQGDFFRVTLDSAQIFRESFANARPDQIQSYVPPPGVELARHVDLGFSGPGGYFTDSAYDMSLDPVFHHLPHTTSTATFTFRIEGPGIQPLDDESWAIDNLRVLIECPLPIYSFQPAPATSCPSGTAVFSVSATGTGPFTYQWQVQLPSSGEWNTLGNDPGPISCPGGGSGFAFATPFNSPTVSIGVHGCPSVQHWPIRCIVSNACGSVTSNEATLTLCPADFNCDGALNSADFFDFLTAFFTGAPAADFNHDTIINSQDFFDFLAAFFTGC